MRPPTARNVCDVRPCRPGALSYVAAASVATGDATARAPTTVPNALRAVGRRRKVRTPASAVARWLSTSPARIGLVIAQGPFPRRARRLAAASCVHEYPSPDPGHQAHKRGRRFAMPVRRQSPAFGEASGLSGHVRLLSMSDGDFNTLMCGRVKPRLALPAPAANKIIHLTGTVLNTYSAKAVSRCATIY